MLLQGNLKDRPLPQLLYQIYSERKTGTLMLSLNELRKAILFDSGQILSAYSNQREDSLGEVLLRLGKITVDQYLEAEAYVKQGKRFGQVLLESETLTEAELTAQISYQVLGIIYSLFLWQIGYYEFAEGKLPQKDLPRLELSTLDIIFRGIKMIRSWEQIRKTIDSLDEELELVPDYKERLKGLQLSKDELMVLNMIEPGVTIRDITLLSNFNSFETCRLLMGFIVIGLARKRSLPSWITPIE
ncbi:MAG: DUF4388 domain-containing protein [Acidobacteriota bacterium]|nr:DUF4388 domain-containing protein [Blastocatellia bacterium]MDW8413453.1 DUF4388 domain-containing protein [Acidobacteriota bacterium]